MQIASLADASALEPIAVAYFQAAWGSTFVPWVYEDGTLGFLGFKDNTFTDPNWFAILHDAPASFAVLKVEPGPNRVRIIYVCPTTLTLAQWRAGVRFLVQQAQAHYPNVNPANWVIYMAFEKLSPYEMALHDTLQVTLSMTSQDFGTFLVLAKNLGQFAAVV